LSSEPRHLNVKGLTLDPFWNAYQQLQDKLVALILLMLHGPQVCRLDPTRFLAAGTV